MKSFAYRSLSLIASGVVALCFSAAAARTDDTLKSIASGDMAGLTISTAHAPEPATRILDASGKRIALADIKAQGKLLVVDLWATWCGGCVREMPTFAKLQAAYAGRIVVAPVSMDAPKDREKARTFVAQFSPLPFLQSPADPWPPALTTALAPKVRSFPTAIIYDRNGKEVARMMGQTADWNGRDAHRLFDYLLAHSPT
jgi:thiol-disulfide isomerase/thioredoxin